MLALAAANPAVTHGKAGLVIDHLASFAASGNVHLIRAANCENPRISPLCQGIFDNGDSTANLTTPLQYPYPALGIPLHRESSHKQPRTPGCHPSVWWRWWRSSIRPILER
jgi:hypothetical protein